MLTGGAAAAALWAAIGIGVGAIVRNQVGAVVGLCVWLLLVESILIGDVPSAGKFAPGASAGALAGIDPERHRRRAARPGLGALLLIAYAAAAALAGADRDPTARHQLTRSIRMQPDDDRQSTGRKNRYAVALLVITVVVLMVVLHLTGVVGPGTH